MGRQTEKADTMRMTEDYWDYNKRDILRARTPEDLAEGNFEVVSPVEAAATLRWMIRDRNRLLELLRDAVDYVRHPDYDWDLYFTREVDDVIDEIDRELDF